MSRPRQCRLAVIRAPGDRVDNRFRRVAVKRVPARVLRNLFLAGSALVLGCDIERPGGAVEHAGASAGQADSAHPSPVDSSLTALNIGVPTTVEAVTVVGFRGPGDKPFEVAARTPVAGPAHARRFGVKTLVTSLRTDVRGVVQYPCTSCHMGRGTVLSDKRMDDVHQNITPLHPAATGATCSTCHYSGNVELLALKSGERPTIDHAYRLCAQCHFRQAEAWAAGAHGKRLDGWQGRRVVMGCADCHDPHAPAVQQRIPFRAPLIQRERVMKK
jgi:hypothetical protein